MNNRIAVLIPCYNEEMTVAKVVSDFKKYLPDAVIYVYDNNSTDRTVALARKAGAIVHNEPNQGKGYVVTRMFADIDADVYVMVDGDATYDASKAPLMIDTLLEGNLDMVNGVRVSKEKQAYRFGHRLGNRLLTKVLSITCGCQTPDMLSGYRVFSRRFVKSFPWQSKGFDIETKLTVYAATMKLPVANIETPYFSRPVKSPSKLNTYKDGVLILSTIFLMMKEERSFLFFAIISGLFALLALILGIPLITEYQETGLVSRIPTAVIIVGLATLALLSFVCGLILDTVSKSTKENRRLKYLSHFPSK